MVNFNRIEGKFLQLKKSHQGALICYVVGGYPDVKTSIDIITSLVNGGADIIEIGIPFSDPIADGTVIQKASTIALSNHVTPDTCLELATIIRKRFPELPLLFMTYSNILLRQGFKRFMMLSKTAGIDGFIIPDLTIEEATDYLKFAQHLNLATIFLVSPNTSEQRIRKISKSSKGFIYLVSVYGITGMRESFDSHTTDMIKTVKQITYNNNIAVGFGISDRSHVKLMIDAGADGVIVGSAIVNLIGNERTGLKKRMFSYANLLKKACKLQQ